MTYRLRAPWRSINTAPKDGTWFNGLTTHGKVVCAHWVTEDDPDEAYGSHEWGRGGTRFKLIGWQPLPAAPARYR
jgi:hypothetical protein